MAGEMRCTAHKRTTIKESLVKKYKWSDKDATEFSDFLLPMLVYEPLKRATAAEMLKHAWLQGLSEKQTENLHLNVKSRSVAEYNENSND